MEQTIHNGKYFINKLSDRVIKTSKVCVLYERTICGVTVGVTISMLNITVMDAEIIF